MTEFDNHCLPVADLDRLLDQAENVFDLVWRVDFTAPGFALLEVAPGIDSHTCDHGWSI